MFKIRKEIRNNFVIQFQHNGKLIKKIPRFYNQVHLRKQLRNLLLKEKGISRNLFIIFITNSVQKRYKIRFIHKKVRFIQFYENYLLQNTNFYYSINSIIFNIIFNIAYGYNTNILIMN